MAHKKRSVESSLELLLDTMCNTFGGVMFIGISIVVMMSMLSPKDAPVKQKENQLKIEQLQLELEKLTADTAEMDKLLLQFDSDPNKDLVKELLNLDRKLQEVSEQEKLLEKQKLEAEQERQKLLKDKALVAKQMEDLLAEHAAKQKRLEELERRTAAMKQNLQQVKDQTMSFRVMEKSTKIFYVLIIWQDKIWKAGPELDSKQKFVGNDDCSCQPVKSASGLDGIRFTPVAGRGIPVLSGDSLNPEALDLLKSIPADRIPRFTIAKDSIQSFVKLRAYMKEAHILHGVDTQFEKEKKYTIYIADKAEYEY